MSATHNHLSVEDKNKLVQFLHKSSINGKLDKGKINEAAALYGVCRKTVSIMWAKAKGQMEQGRPILVLSSRLGVPQKKKTILDEEKMRSIEFSKRSTIRGLAKGMEVSKTTIGRWIKARLIKPHTNAIKPYLTDSNKLQMIQYSLSRLKFDSESNKINFNDMRNVIHIDEKWFYITKASRKCYKLPSEPAPYRSCKSKRFITKVMFLCAVGRPQYDSDGTLLFDGKVGMFPFTEQVQAQRNSKNRLKGTLETKHVESITKQVIKKCIITQVIPILKSKWPTNASKDIIIQQDNAKPHIANNDVDFRAASSSDGFNIQLVCQPPNSPDTNINDLGWFRSIQSLQQSKKTETVEGLVQDVSISFEELTATTLNKVFLSLQGCCIEIFEGKGHYDFNPQHMNKDKKIREGTLPDCLEVDEMLVRECIEWLMQIENQVETSYDVQTLRSDLGY